MPYDPRPLPPPRPSQAAPAIARARAQASTHLRLTLALVGGAIGWWLASLMSAQGHGLWLAVLVGAGLGAVYEMLSLGLLVAVALLLVRCAG